MVQPRIADAATANERFVTRLYSDFLQRPPASNELTWGRTALDGGVDRGYYVGTVLESSPFQTLWVESVYQRCNSAAPTSSQMSAALADLESSDDYVKVEVDVLASVGYFNLVGGTNELFVASLFEDILWQEIDPAAPSYWVDQLHSGARTRSNVAESIIRSTESSQLRVRGISEQSSECISTVIGGADDLASGSYCLILDRIAGSAETHYWSTYLKGTGQLPWVWTNLAASNEYYWLTQQ